MQFDHLVKSILKEHQIDVSKLPVLDGKKEVYCMAIVTAQANHTGAPIATPVERMDFDYGNPMKDLDDSDPYNCTGWVWEAYENIFSDTLLYSGKHFEDVVNLLKSIQEQTLPGFEWKYLDDRLLTRLAVHKLRPFANIHGTWKVIDATGTGKRGEGVFIGIEVDQDYYRHGGITDAVTGTVEGEDISNW